MKQLVLVIGLAVMTVGAALPAQASEGWNFTLQLLPGEEFILGVTPDGHFFAYGGTQAPLPNTPGPVSPARLDGCATVPAAGLSSCSGSAGSHATAAPGLAMSGVATSPGLSGSASVTLTWNTGAVHSFTCSWTSANGAGVYGALVYNGACGPLGTPTLGTSWTMSGSQSSGNAGALAHLTI